MAEASGPYPLRPAEAARVGEILAFRAASGDVPTAQIYFNNLIAAANLPTSWVLAAHGLWTGNPLVDARRLITWAESKEVNPEYPGMSTLGSILSTALDDLGVGQRKSVAAVIVARRLFLDDGLVRDLMQKYPLVTGSVEQRVQPTSVDLLEQPESTDDVELQRLFKPLPDFLDVGFIARVLECAPAVCKVEDKHGVELGTGVLLSNTRVLTNQHVVDMARAAEEIRVRFGYITSPSGREAEGTVYAVDQDRPVVVSSPEQSHDFALLAVDVVTGVESPTVDYRRTPERGTGLNILQHPRGESMKVAITSNGVVRAFVERGVLHYVTRTAGGSSGSPCFNDDWQMVALHRAERSRPIGSIREGVLMSAIWSSIESHL